MKLHLGVYVILSYRAVLMPTTYVEPEKRLDAEVIS